MMFDFINRGLTRRAVLEHNQLYGWRPVSSIYSHKIIKTS